jgi:SNF2 family DNA or RNA helicase
MCRDSHWANFSEMGAGKSLPAAILAQGVIEDGICDYVFIIAPKIVLGDWVKLFGKQLDCDWKNLISYYHAPRTVRKHFKLRPIVIMSYETVMGDLDKFKVLAQAYKCMIVLDEAHKLRNHDSLRTKGISQLADFCTRVYLLTGTPITNGLKNAFSYINLLRPGVYYNTFNSFKLRHMRYSPYDRRVLIGYRNVEAVQGILQSFSVRHLKKEILDLPPVTFQTRLIDWEPKQKKIYKDMVDDYIVELEDSFLEATNAAARMVRLHQILTNPQQLGLDCDSTRWKVINEDLESIDLTVHKVVILCHYRASVKRLLTQLATYNPACIYGGTTDVEKEKTKFDDDVSCRIMIAHPLSAGLGVNFTVAAYMIFFEYSWDLDSYDQTVSRCNRPGQIYPLTVINYAVKGGMEQRKILPKLVEKKDFATHLLNDPKEFIEFITLEEKDELSF